MDNAVIGFTVLVGVAVIVSILLTIGLMSFDTQIGQGVYAVTTTSGQQITGQVFVNRNADPVPTTLIIRSKGSEVVLDSTLVIDIRLVAPGVVPPAGRGE